MTEEKIKELEYKIQIGLLAQNFLKSDFWNKALKPSWEQRPSQLKQEFRYPENRQQLETMGILSAIHAGRLEELTFQEEMMKRWMTEGQEAQRILDKINEKRSPISIFR